MRIYPVVKVIPPLEEIPREIKAGRLTASIGEAATVCADWANCDWSATDLEVHRSDYYLSASAKLPKTFKRYIVVILTTPPEPEFNEYGEIGP